MACTLEQLRDELISRVSLCPQVQDSTFKVFNLEDLENISMARQFPIAGVTYEGSAPVENSASGATGSRIKASSLLTRHFVVIVGVNYRYAKTGEGQLATAESLLEAILPNVLGYQGVNSRPWTFSGETAMETSLEGAVFYGQMWETVVPFSSNTTT